MPKRLAVCASLTLVCQTASVRAQPQAAPAPAPQPRTFDVNEYLLEGCRLLSDLEIETTLTPFLGPDRRLQDIESARAALEKAYLDRGYQSVSVAIPPQTVREGIVRLKVTEGSVGRLRVRGARWFSPEKVKQQAPSMAEGLVPNFNRISNDLIVLNQIPDRRVTPALRAGASPGTVDVDLLVQDTLPLHGSAELNNRHGRFTSPLRLSGALRYDNLWQSGHSLGFTYQVAPRRPNDGTVFTANYVARFGELPWLTLSASYLDQHSDVSVIGGVNVAGTGQIIGARASFTLPGSTSYFHSVSTGFDYKRFGQLIHFGESANSSPITTWPVTAQYGGIFSRESSETVLTIGLTFGVRALGSSTTSFDDRRFNASGNFIYYRGELSRSEKLPSDFQLFARLQGQYTADPLISSDQFSAGGAESVRGYYESEVIGDFGASGTIELRGPSLAKWIGSAANEWRIHLFADGALLGIHDPLPEQQSRFRLWSVGAGTRLKLFNHGSGEFEIAVPMRTEGITRKSDVRYQFRLATFF